MKKKGGKEDSSFGEGSADTHQALIVETASYDEVGAVIELCRKGHLSDGGWYPDEEYPHIHHYMIDQVSKGFLFVARVKGEVVGCAIVNATSWPWAPGTWHYQNDFLYVNEEHRGTSAADKLMEAMIELAERKKARLHVTFTYGTDEEIIKGFMGKHGAIQTGLTYVLNWPTK